MLVSLAAVVVLGLAVRFLTGAGRKEAPLIREGELAREIESLSAAGPSGPGGSGIE